MTDDNDTVDSPVESSTGSEDSRDTETIDIPIVRFANELIPQARETPVEYFTSDEIQEKVGFRDVFTASNVEGHNVSDDHIEMWFETTSTVSERVARKTHHHPAEYKNHEVTVFGTLIWEFTPDDQLPVIHAEIGQDEYPLEPPAPDV